MTVEALVPTGAPGAVIDRGWLRGAEMKARMDVIYDVMNSVMEVGVDYGKIPGTDKPTLYKAGAEKLCVTFSLSACDPTIEDLSTPDEIRYRQRVPVTAPDGRVLGVGVGEASTNEERYRWRKAVCDEEWQETDAGLRREKWFKGRDGGAPWKQKQIRTSPADLANTVLKMSHKRAYVHGTLMATGASWLFNQDLEDLQEELRDALLEDEGQKKPETKQPQRKSANGTAATPAAKPLPGNAQIVTGFISRVYDDKKPFAILLKDHTTKYTTFDEGVAKEAKQFAGTDHQVKLAYTVTQKDGRTFYNAVGISIADAEPVKTAAGPPQQPNLHADDIFASAREPGAEG